MDVKYPAMVVACADKQIYVFDLNKPTEVGLYAYKYRVAKMHRMP